jgi:predicted HicB family RNase H-like nuclease/DNA-binding FrmR family transcriptional regulator
MENNVLKYKEFYGVVEYSPAKDCFCGKIKGIKETVTFEGESVSSLKKAFYEAVDSYIIACEQKGKETKKSYKGSFNVRVTPELHRDAANAAVQKNISLNAFVEQAIYNGVYEKLKKSKSEKEKKIMLYTYVKQNYNFTYEDKKECLKIFQQLLAISQKTRKSGLLALEEDIKKCDNLYLKEGLELLLDSWQAEAVSEIFDKYIIFGNHTSKEILELLLIKEGVVSICNGITPRVISSILSPFFGKDFMEETEKAYENYVTGEVDEFWRQIKDGRKYYPNGTNLLEAKFKDLNDESIQKLIRVLSVDDAILAIIGSSAEVTDKLLRNMSKRTSDKLIETIVFFRDYQKYNNLESIIEAQNKILGML